MKFRNRDEAGKMLADRISALKTSASTNVDDSAHYAKPIVMGLPRGGVPVAFPISERLKCPLDVVIVRKLGVPYQEEVAMGAIASLGGDVVTIWNDDIAPYLSEQKREEVYQRELKSLKIRNDLFRHNAPPIDLSKFSSVILVDDGMATGATMRSAIESIRHQSPKTHIICAIPVSSDSAMDKIKPSETKKGQDIADEVICLDVPPMFWGVGGFYDDFTQVHEDIVVSMLQKSQKYHSQNK